MKDKIILSIFIPVYNESLIIENTIKKSLASIEQLKLNFELVITDDGSEDETSEIVRRMMIKDKRIRLFRKNKNYGRGEILNLAFRTAKGDIVAFYDADLSVDLSYLPSLIHSIKDLNYDVATGSRWLKGAKVKRGLSRLFISFLYNKIISFIFDTKLKDHQCGFKGFKKHVILNLVKYMGVDKYRRWSWDTELLLRSQMMGYKIHEFPINFEEKRRTKTKLIRDSIVVSRHIFKLYLTFLFHRIKNLFLT